MCSVPRMHTDAVTGGVLGDPCPSTPVGSLAAGWAVIAVRRADVGVGEERFDDAHDEGSEPCRAR